MGSQRVGHDWVTELNWTEHLRSPYSGITAFVKDLSLLFPPFEDTERRWSPKSATRKGASPEPSHADILILDFPASRSGSKIFLLFISHMVCYFCGSPWGLRHQLQWCLSDLIQRSKLPTKNFNLNLIPMENPDTYILILQPIKLPYWVCLFHFLKCTMVFHWY